MMMIYVYPCKRNGLPPCAMYLSVGGKIYWSRDATKILYTRPGSEGSMKRGHLSPSAHRPPPFSSTFSRSASLLIASSSSSNPDPCLLKIQTC